MPMKARGQYRPNEWKTRIAPSEHKYWRHKLANGGQDAYKGEIPILAKKYKTRRDAYEREK